VLGVTMPVADKVKPRRVEINAGAEREVVRSWRHSGLSQHTPDSAPRTGGQPGRCLHTAKFRLLVREA